TLSLPATAVSEDEFFWETNGTSDGSFSAAHTWEVLRPRETKKQWAELIWFKGAVPKYAFNMWIANADRLPTRTRLASWGLNIPTCCPLCSSHHETRDHLLLTCDFSKEIWRWLFDRLDRSRHSRSHGLNFFLGSEDRRLRLPSLFGVFLLRPLSFTCGSNVTMSFTTKPLYPQLKLSVLLTETFGPSSQPSESERTLILSCPFGLDNDLH
ncbi:unnamed protein product, partial [Brassica rapa]